MSQLRWKSIKQSALRVFGPIVALAAFVSCAILGGARADDIADFYKGATLRFIVGYEPGGGMDLYARLIARHVAVHLPGRPRVVVENMPGASSMIATNYVYNVAPQDGTVVLAAGAALPFTPLFGDANAKFDALKFNWLPAPASEITVLTLWHDAAVKSIADARTTEATLATNGATGTAGFYGRLLNAVLDTRFKLIAGYKGGNAEALLAMERGEVDGHPGIPWATLKATKQDWLREGKLQLLVQYGGKPHPDLKDTPFARDLITSDEDKAMFDVGIAPLVIGRPYMQGPRVPADRAAAMRKAFQATFADKDFLADAEHARVDIDPSPLSGEQVREIVASTYAASPDIIGRLKKMVGASAP
jgi:tripartite-type tricarboxylate transporter receptor subunit TctC